MRQRGSDTASHHKLEKDRVLVYCVKTEGSGNEDFFFVCLFVCLFVFFCFAYWLLIFG